jgi:hypothetical protein
VAQTVGWSFHKVIQMPKNIVVRLTREQTYSHLFTLCQNDELFTIINYPDGWREEDWGRIVISDAKAIISGIERAVIGTVRLLPYDSGTTIMFVNKDAIWHKEMTKADEKLFEKYIERAISHFTDLSLLIHNPSEAAQKQLSEGNELSQGNINQIIVNGNIIGSNVIAGNENKASNSPKEGGV